MAADIPFSNPRAPHVETEQEGLAGCKFHLGRRVEKAMDENVAVMYEVVGVRNGNHVAHCTVYFGKPGAEAARH